MEYRRSDIDVLVFVYFSQLIFVAALELPEFPFMEAGENGSLPLLDGQLVKMSELFPRFFRGQRFSKEGTFPDRREGMRRGYL